VDKVGIFKKCLRVPDITSKGLWEMFEGDFADMCAKKIHCYQWGLSGGSSLRRPRSEDLYRLVEIFYIKILKLDSI
jgi:hypothetical protein